jgi:hypothetical protein
MLWLFVWSLVSYFGSGFSSIIRYLRNWKRMVFTLHFTSMKTSLMLVKIINIVCKCKFIQLTANASLYDTLPKHALKNSLMRFWGISMSTAALAVTAFSVFLHIQVSIKLYLKLTCNVILCFLMLRPWLSIVFALWPEALIEHCILCYLAWGPDWALSCSLYSPRPWLSIAFFVI